MTRRQTTVDSPGMQRILSALRVAGPMDEIDLAQAAILARRTVHNHIRLLKAAGLVHVGARRYNRQGSCSPVFAIGPGVDARKLPPTDPVSRRRAWAERTGELAKKRARKRLAKVDPITAALMGIRA